MASASEPDRQELPKQLEELAELLVGENLPRSFLGRRVSDSMAARAARELIAKGDESVPALEATFDSDDEIHRLNVVYVLNSIGSPATVRIRLRAAQDSSTEVRALAIVSLPVYSDMQAYKAALDALSDSAASVRIAAIYAFSPTLHKGRPDQVNNSRKYAIAKTILGQLGDLETRHAAAVVLGDLKMNVAAKPLLKAMEDERSSVRAEIVESLATIGDRQITMEVVPYLKDPHPYVRNRTAFAIGELQDIRATPELIEALSDSEVGVRIQAAEAMGKIRDRRAVPSLLASLEEGALVGQTAARALGLIGDPTAVEGLCKALQIDEQTASAAAVSLGDLGDPRAVKSLGRYLRGHPNSQLAAQSLARIRHPTAVEELAKISSSVNSNAVRSALGALTGQRVQAEDIAEWWQENREVYFRPDAFGTTSNEDAE